MLSLNCEDIPAKEDTNLKTSCSNLNQTANNASILSNGQRLQQQFQQKTKFLRDIWTQTQSRVKINRDHSQLFIIILLSFIAIVCSLIALTSNNWTCDSNRNSRFGLWNTCYEPLEIKNETTIINTTLPLILNRTGILCAQQGLFDVRIEYAEQARIGQLQASQGLIVSGTILYFFSIISIILAYRFIQVSNLNSVRNALVASMVVQIISFFMQLIGFFLFVLTDRLSISIGLLFVYFGLAIFATNIINFITIEYKAAKSRQISI